jgi:hypothetical protein
MAIGFGGLRETTEAQLRAGQQHPAGQIFGVLLQMRGEPRDRVADVGMAGRAGRVRGPSGRRPVWRPGAAAIGKRLVRQGGRAELPVHHPGGERQQQDHDRRHRKRNGAGADLGPGRAQREDAASDLDPRRFGLIGGQEAARDIALDLGQLVAVDGEVVGVARGRAAAHQQQRHQQNSQCEAGQPDERDGEPEVQGSAPSPRIAARRRRSSALSFGTRASRRLR